MGVLNRRFVFCFYNAFSSNGADAAANKFFKEHGGRGYGAIFTPDGKCLGSFGFNVTEFYHVLKSAAKNQPEYWHFDDNEKKILADAEKNPSDLDAQRDAARLHTELLDFERAAEILESFLERTNDRKQEAIAKYWAAHLALSESDLLCHQYVANWNRLSEDKRDQLLKRRQVIAEQLSKLDNLSEDLLDDRAVDLITLEVRLRPGRGFYTGWQFKPDADKKAIAKQLQDWIKRSPSSNRIGQMHFLLSLAYADDGDLKSADQIWQKHIDNYPADRFAMLSRFHHTSYQFSPYKGGRGGVVIGGRTRRLTAEEVERQLQRLKPKRTKRSFQPVGALHDQKELPDPFLRPDGSRVQSTTEWEGQRTYLKSLVAHYMYGHMPPRPLADQLSIKKTLSRAAFEETALEEHLTVNVKRGDKSVDLRIALFRPSEKKRHPTIIKNCRVLFDREQVTRTRFAIMAERDLAAAREAVRRGYVTCKFLREDLAPDRRDNRDQGIFPLYPEYDWGTIAVWAWGHQVVLDVLDQLGYANMDQIVCTGHSRGGQTAMAAGIFDERIDVVVPCTGGFGSVGTLRVRDPKGVRGTIDYIAHLSQKNPHWFNERYYDFAGHQDKLPFDAHTLVALVAPRPLLNTNATEDQNNNTLSIEAGLRTGKRVYDWLQVGDRCRVHWRPGEHAQQKEDWQALLDFADEMFFNRRGTSKFNAWVYPNLNPAPNWSAPRRPLE